MMYLDKPLDNLQALLQAVWVAAEDARGGNADLDAVLIRIQDEADDGNDLIRAFREGAGV